MPRRTLLATIVGLFAAPAIAQRHPAPQAPGNADRGYGPAGDFEIVAAITGPGPSGIAVTPEGRVFLGFPRHADDHDGATVAELRDGRLVPFPSAALSLPSDAPPRDRLVSVHGMTIDAEGRLWAIDTGKRAKHPIPDGGAKVMAFDPATGEVVARLVLAPPALLPDSHMNDLRVDLTHGPAGTVYVSDSSFGTSPALVVVDVATGIARRVMADHRSINAEPGLMVVQEGRPLVYDPEHPTFTVGGVDGLALSPDGSRLYYAALTSRRLYSIQTDILSDPGAAEQQLAAAIRDEGEKGVADGLASDATGRIYTTNFEHDAILRRNLDGSFETLVRDPRIVSPDGIFVTSTHVYCTLGQWNRLPSFNAGQDLRRPPYLLIRCPIDGPVQVRAD